MNHPDPPTPDIFLSCATRDLARADDLARQFAAAGLSVRRVSELQWQQAVAADEVSGVWAALRESVALVVLGTPAHTHSPILAMEVGGAMSREKPIHVLVETAQEDLPSYLRRQHLHPVSAVSAVTQAVKRKVQPRSSPRNGGQATSRRSRSDRVTPS